ncbi:F-box/kelch-repeat protein At3g23880-like [Rutidosis leptorrhynchoides]|uniref:F-box/kelch-repeat protein At3g23880-like n=2 Tax=Rutidosis leptorrhynchoides TaxID=125765 RepID=UPI003A9A0E07
MEDYLPKELLSDILSKLPSKTILRCRSVCKSWFSLISTREFQIFYLEKYNKSNPRLLMRRYDLMHDREMYSVHHDSLALTVDPDTVIEFPFNCTPCPRCYLRIIGSIDGVVCLGHKKCAYKEEKIILWNPSIRIKLPIFPPMMRIRRMLNYSVALGFGYDKVTDDYKVVRLAYNYHYSPRPQVDIYGVKTAIWRAIPFPSDFLCIYFKGSPVYLNGCVYWIMYRWVSHGWHIITQCSIMKFDVSAEMFEEIQLPEPLDDESPINLELELFNERLIVIKPMRLQLHSRGASKYNMWALNNYENQNSWEEICKISYGRIDLGRVLRIRDNGELIMGARYGKTKIRDRNVGYYDSECRGFIMEDSIYIDKYQESLALLDVGDDVLSEDRRGAEGLNE